jgi:hypothetical protein
MARIYSHFPEAISLAQDFVNQSRSSSDTKRGLSVTLSAPPGMTVGRTAELPGISTMTVNRDRHLTEGTAGTEFHETTENRGGRRNQLMTPEEEEAEFLDKFLDQSPAGELIDAAPIHNQPLELAGHDIPLSATYRMLKEMGGARRSRTPAALRAHPPRRRRLKKNPKNASFHLEEKQRKIT